MGKVDFHSTGKVWENTNITKLCFSNILVEAEIDIVPKIWEKWISIVREKYGKTQTFQIYEFPKYFGLNGNPYDSQNMEKVNSHISGGIWEKQTF